MPALDRAPRRRPPSSTSPAAALQQRAVTTEEVQELAADLAAILAAVWRHRQRQLAATSGERAGPADGARRGSAAAAGA